MRVVIGMIAAVLVAACGSSSSSGTGPSSGGHSATIVASSTISGGNYFFSPNPDTVNANSTVTFQIGSVVHNVHFDTGPATLDSIPAQQNVSVGRTFPTAGTYTFHCSIHNFSGTVVAQ